MGQVVSCCFGTPDLEDVKQPPKDKIRGSCDEQASLTPLECDPLPKATLVEQHSDACTATSDESSPPTSVCADVAHTEMVNDDEDEHESTSTNDNSNDTAPCEIEEEHVPEIFVPPMLVSQRSRSTSDMLTEIPHARPMWGRSQCNRNLIPVDKDPTTTSLTMDEVRVNWYAVTVQHFTPRLTGSVYDFYVTVYGHPAPIRVSHTRHACKAFYAKLQKLRHDQTTLTKKLLPPFPPKAGLGLVKTTMIDANSCSFMQDFLDHLLAIPTVRNSPVTLSFFHVADPFAARAC